MLEEHNGGPCSWSRVSEGEREWGEVCGGLGLLPQGSWGALTQVLTGALLWLPPEGQSVWKVRAGALAETSTLVQVGDDGLDQVEVEEGGVVERTGIDFEGTAGSIG